MFYYEPIDNGRHNDSKDSKGHDRTADGAEDRIREMKGDAGQDMTGQDIAAQDRTGKWTEHR